jgi:hypothetical protein
LHRFPEVSHCSGKPPTTGLRQKAQKYFDGPAEFGNWTTWAVRVLILEGAEIRIHHVGAKWEVEYSKASANSHVDSKRRRVPAIFALAR